MGHDCANDGERSLFSAAQVSSGAFLECFDDSFEEQLLCAEFSAGKVLGDDVLELSLIGDVQDVAEGRRIVEVSFALACDHSFHCEDELW